jgi:hypothetical protein
MLLSNLVSCLISNFSRSIGTNGTGFLLDKFIQKKRKEYTDPNSSQNMSRLNEDLADIHNIMRQNIQEVLNRGERVESKYDLVNL